MGTLVTGSWEDVQDPHRAGAGGAGGGWAAGRLDKLWEPVGLQQGKTALKNVYTIFVYPGWGPFMHSWPSNFCLLSVVLLVEVDGLTHTLSFFLHLSEASFP